MSLITAGPIALNIAKSRSVLTTQAPGIPSVGFASSLKWVDTFAERTSVYTPWHTPFTATNHGQQSNKAQTDDDFHGDS